MLVGCAVAWRPSPLPVDQEPKKRVVRIRACLHSPGAEGYSDGVDHRGEAYVGLFIARRDASKHLYCAEEVFDEVTPFVLFGIVRGVSAGPLAHRNHSLDALASQIFA